MVARRAQRGCVGHSGESARMREPTNPVWHEPWKSTEGFRVCMFLAAMLPIIVAILMPPLIDPAINRYGTRFILAVSCSMLLYGACRSWGRSVMATAFFIFWFLFLLAWTVIAVYEWFTADSLMRHNSYPW